MSKPNNPIRENISKHITAYLKETNMSKAKFGKSLGVTATSVTRWIEMQCAPDYEIILELTKLLNVSILDLFGIDFVSNITPKDTEILKAYRENKNFSKLVDNYLSDEEFRQSIDYLLKSK